MQFVDELRTYGLSEKEASVYLALLSRGPATANQASERADLVRTTTYDVLKSLKERGIVSVITKNNVLHYEAAPPEKLVNILEEKKRALTTILPNLKQLSQPEQQGPSFELFEGKEGIKTVYQDILDNAHHLQAISNTKKVTELLPHYIQQFIKQRVSRGITIQLLSEKTLEAEKLKKNDSKEKRETRYLEELGSIPISEYIYDDNVAIINTNILEPLGIIIRNKDFAKAQQQLFALLWKKSSSEKEVKER